MCVSDLCVINTSHCRLARFPVWLALPENIPLGFSELFSMIIGDIFYPFCSFVILFHHFQRVTHRAHESTMGMIPLKCDIN